MITSFVLLIECTNLRCFDLVISTERNLLIDKPTISPFNIGLRIPLEPFDLKESLRLNGRFEKLVGKSLNSEDVKRLFDLLQGQPYLMHEAIYAVTYKRFGSAKKLIEKADTDASPFADHLRALSNRIMHRAEYNLANALRQIIAGDSLTDQYAIGRLKAAGLVRIERGTPIPANHLYARFFGKLFESGKML